MNKAQISVTGIFKFSCGTVQHAVCSRNWGEKRRVEELVEGLKHLPSASGERLLLSAQFIPKATCWIVSVS